MHSIKHKSLCFVFILITALSAGIPVAFAATHISENITEDTTWTIENSPFVIDNSVRISQNATLNIEPGVVVKFTPYSEIYFYDDEDGDDHGGSIIANGTSENKIYFTSIEDDEAGGDTSENGTVSISEIDENSNTWYGITAGGSLSRVSFENVVFRYSIYGLGTGKIQDVEIEDSVFEKNYIGISDSGESHINISNTKIINNYDGISAKQLYEAPNSIYVTEGLSIYGNTRYGVRNQTDISYQTKNDVNIFDWLVNLFKPNNVLAQEEPEPENNSEQTPENLEETEEIPQDIPEEELDEGPVYDYTLDFKNTWWGDASGPFSDSNPDGLGNEVSGPVDFTPFCKNPTCKVRNPVLIVPGLLGTEISKPTADGFEKLWLDIIRNIEDIGDQFMDALQFNKDLTSKDTTLFIGEVVRKATAGIFAYDYSEGLIKEFENQGYIEDTDLFLFPYDWRYGVSEDNVTKLKQKISDIVEQTNSEKVDIVAHSMGGLLVKKYVVENPDNNHIDKAVFVGVPNTGSVKAVKNLLTGDGTIITADSEMKKLSENMPAAYDLLPSQAYFDSKGSYVQIIDSKDRGYSYKDLNYNEVNSFLTIDHKLNLQAAVNAIKLHTFDFDNYDLRTAGINLFSINGCKAGTLYKVKELHAQNPLHKSIVDIRYLEPEEGPGDGTVPFESATNLPINPLQKFYSLKGTHAEMMSSDGIRQKIVNIISGSDLSTGDIITQSIDECELNGRALSVYSPLNIDVTDQDGNHAGLNEDGVSIENNIPNADFQIMGEHKFVYLPTDEGQTYDIKIKGTGTGTFTFTDAEISGSETQSMQVFNNIAVTPSLLGNVNISDTTNLDLDNDGDGTIDLTLNPDSLLNQEEAENFIPPAEEPNSGSSKPSSTTGSPAKNKEEVAIQPNDDVSVLDLKKFRPTVLGLSKTTDIIHVEEKTNEFKSLEEYIEKSNNLTANVADTHNNLGYKNIISLIAGVLIFILVARKYNKL